MPSDALDALDADLLALLTDEPRVGVLEASRRLGVARGTVQARLDRLQRRGAVTGFGPDVDAAAVGYPVTAYCSLEIRQGEGHDVVAAHLDAIPEVLEAHTITGAGDVLVRVVARSNADLQRVIDQVVAGGTVLRTSTLIALQVLVPHRTLPLVRAAAAGTARGAGPVREDDPDRAAGPPRRSGRVEAVKARRPAADPQG